MSALPHILGVVNVTPDSFSDGGAHRDASAAIEHGRRLLAEGAERVDVGGESTRPGAPSVPEEIELERVLPVVRGLAATGRVCVDTRRAVVARAALDAGAVAINDVTGGDDPAMLRLCAEAGCDVVLMHMRGDPASMMGLASYTDVVAEVWAALDARAARARAAGVADHRICVDPGLGFAKTADHNLSILRDLGRYTDGRTVLIGASRKSFLGRITGQDVPADRVEASLAVALWAAEHGAAWVRVHDVAATRRAFATWAALRAGGL